MEELELVETFAPGLMNEAKTLHAVFKDRAHILTAGPQDEDDEEQRPYFIVQFVVIQPMLELGVLDGMAYVYEDECEFRIFYRDEENDSWEMTAYYEITLNGLVDYISQLPLPFTQFIVDSENEKEITNE